MIIQYRKAILAFLLFPVFALAADENPEAIDEIVVSADRVNLLDGHRVDESEGSQLIAADYIRAQQATTLADALRKTTSVQVDEEGGNQGSAVIIRGLSQDQVSVRVDGAPKNFNQVRHGGAGTVYAEPDMYRSIAVIPGVSSNVYGSGSLGGMVQLETKDPQDIFKSDERWAGNVRLGYESNGNAEYAAMDNAVAFSEAWSGLLTVTSRNSESYEDGSGVETLGGATGSEDINTLAKLVYDAGGLSRVEVSYLGLDKDYTSRGARSQGTTVSPTDQFTEVEERTYSGNWQITPLSDLVDVNVRYTRTSTERERLNDGDTEASFWGTTTDYAELENISRATLFGKRAHKIRYGVDWTYDDIHTAYSDSDGLPLLREREALGVYVSDSFDVLDPLSALVSVRYDRFETRDVNSGRSLEESAVNPKFQVIWSPFENTSLAGLSLVGLVGQGFRTPSVHEMFGRGETGIICSEGRRGFTCSETVPNGDLKGESSDSWEAGFVYYRESLFDGDGTLYLNVRYVQNDIDGFIQSVALPDGEIEIDGTVYPVSTSTYENVDEAETNGWEFFANYNTSRWFASLTAQNLDGKNLETGEKLRDVSPTSVNASLGFYLFDGRSRVGLDFTSRDDRVVDVTGEDPRFDRLGYEVFDLFGSYEFNEMFSVQLRVENLTDELYTKRYQNLSIDPETGEQQDLTYYQPGRNIKLTLQAAF